MCNIKKVTFSVLFLLCFNNREAARILEFFPIPRLSHHLTLRVYTEELINQGHEVVVITADPAYPKHQAPEGLREIDIHDLAYTTWRNVVKTMSNNETSFKSEIKIGKKATEKVVEESLNHEEVAELLRSKNNTFDLLVTQGFVADALILCYFIKVPTIRLNNVGAVLDLQYNAGTQTHSTIFPHPLSRKSQYTYLWDKIQAVYSDLILNSVYSTESENDDVFRRKFGPEVPTIDKLRENVDLLLFNVHPLWDNCRPLPPGAINMGALEKEHKVRNLPNDIQGFIDSSENGVIYVSFGTNVVPSLLPPEKLKILITVLSKLPYNILMKWDRDELIGRPKNIKISKWYPQKDVLRHPKVKLFITQAGLHSMNEAIGAAVPVITIPVLVDQFYNADTAVKHGIGKTLELNSLTEEQLRVAIDSVITDDSYRRNVANLRSWMRDQPLSPLELSMRWTEYLIRHGGGKHLRAPAAILPYTQYFEIELICIFLAILLSVVSLIIMISYKLLLLIKRYIFRVRS